MSVAVISDVHGNAAALEAALEDARARGVDGLICLGDVVACGPAPEAVIARLVDLGCPCVLGNTDEWLLGRLLPEPHQRDYDKLMRLIEWGTRAIGEDGRRYLASLPPRVDLAIAGRRLLAFHGSPRSSVEVILAETPEPTLREILTPDPAAVYAGGHTHLQLIRRVDEALVVNPGSVGVVLPTAGPPPPVAEYALVATVATGSAATLCRVAVDAASAAAPATMPHAGEWAAILARRVARSNERARAAIADEETSRSSAD